MNLKIRLLAPLVLLSLAAGHGPAQAQNAAAVSVRSVEELRAALAGAVPGQSIVLADGIYSLAGVPLRSTADGADDAPITIRASAPNQAVIRTQGAGEAFRIDHANYVFENLHVQVSGEGSYHAYKLNTGARNIVIRGGIMELFPEAESGVKGSSADSSLYPQAPHPDDVLIENNEIYFTAPSVRDIAEGIDAVGVRNWTVRNNVIHGIQTANRAVVAWGVVLKGNSQDSVIERNLFFDCDVAISVGGTTGRQWYRDADPAFEHRRAVVQNNVSINTRDVALYLEKATQTLVYNNTFINSTMNGGRSSIEIRYAESSADLKNNLLDKPARDRDGGHHSESAGLVLEGQALSLDDFASVSGHDLHIRSGSALFAAAAGQGETIPSVTLDRDGSPRGVGGAPYDIGAYQAGAKR